MAEDLQSKFNEVFTSFQERLYTDVEKSLMDKGHGDPYGSSTGIISSIEFKLVTKAGELGFDMLMNDYWEYLENGRKPASWRFKRGGKGGKSNFIESIKSYIESRDIHVDLKGRTYDKAVTSFAFAIANAINKRGTIKRFGYKGSHFLSDVLNDGRLDTFASELTDLLGEEVVIVVTDKLEA